ncbi:MAG TPA: acetyl-CoA C-acetyltransferase [Legionellales bacterium]|nr:acetyl-CoA C-acetyltransferase [Legionellales bacterium]
MSKDIVIVAAKRTPIGGFLGKLSHLSATELGVISHLACIEQASIPDKMVDEVIMGCVLPAGLGQAPARQTAIKAGLGHQVVCSTINKVCGSGMQSIIHACDAIQNGRSQVVIAGGMESMSNAPYLLPKARSGYRLGHGECLDHMWLDGLQDAYDREKKLMGYFGELTAKTLNISREEQDRFARQSMEKALSAQKKGAFLSELAIVLETNETVLIDEQPSEHKLDKLPRLKPVFQKDGSITAGNASSIADGAASLMLMTEEQAKTLNLSPLAKIKGFASYAQAPEWFTTAPAHSIKKLLKKINWQIHDVDLWEINEAFAVVTLAAIQELNLDPQKVNIHGGACALGHPIGASGARIVVSLIYAMLQENRKKGIASICIGGGEALAIALER